MNYRIWFFKIPPERVQILLSKNGEIRNLLEHKLGIRMEIDEETGSISVKYPPESAENYFLVKKVTDGISAGFSEADIREMIEKDLALVIVDLEEYISRLSHISRIKGRIIGQKGRAKKKIEDYSRCKISIYQNLVGILGPEENIELAREAVIKLVKGFEHQTVYRFMEARLRRMKEDLEIWRRIER